MHLKPGMRLASYASGVDRKSPLRILIALLALGSCVFAATTFLDVLQKVGIDSEIVDYIVLAAGFFGGISACYFVNDLIFKPPFAVILEADSDKVAIYLPQKSKKTAQYTEEILENKGIALVNENNKNVVFRDKTGKVHTLPRSWRKSQEETPRAVGRTINGFLDLTVIEDRLALFRQKMDPRVS